MRRAIVLMAKAPRAGRVKTRLCPPLLHEQAAALCRAFISDVLDVIDRASTSLQLERWVAIAADGESSLDELAGEIIGARTDYRAFFQHGSDLGARIAAAFAAPQAGQTLVLGTDSPAMDPQRIVRAFGALETADVVIGPVIDGGYDLIAARSLPEGLTSSRIPWSTPGVLDATRAIARELGLRVVELDLGRDIDEIVDLDALLESSGDSGPATRDLAKKLRAQHSKERPID